MNLHVLAVVVAVGVLFVCVFVDRVLIPFQARRTVEKLMRRGTPRNPRSLEDAKYGTVTVGVHSLTVRNGSGGKTEWPWTEVEAVYAHKRDLLTTDLICLAFKRSGTDEYVEVHEEMAGYHDLMETLPGRLPKFDLDWMLDVAFPAFETKPRRIWTRSPT